MELYAWQVSFEENWQKDREEIIQSLSRIESGQHRILLSQTDTQEKMATLMFQVQRVRLNRHLTLSKKLTSLFSIVHRTRRHIRGTNLSVNDEFAVRSYRRTGHRCGAVADCCLQG